MGRSRGVAVFAAALLSLWGGGASTQPGPPLTARMGLSLGGEFGFQQNCGNCHVPQGLGGGDPRAPSVETLRQYTPERVYEALTTGKMQVQGAALSDQQRRDISEWVSARTLGAAVAGDASAMPNRCKGGGRLDSARPGWNGWGPDGRNTRFQPARAAGLSEADVPRLRLKWAFGIPGGVQAYSQPTVFGGQLFFGGDGGQIYALDAQTGCVRWSYLAEAGVRSAPVVSASPGAGGGYALYIGDMRANVYALDASNGRLLWKARADDQPLARITASLAVHGGRVYAGLSSSEEISARQKGYECCRHRGSVAAFDARSGALLWKTYMMPPARPATPDASGSPRWGPSGASIWSAPTIDARRGRLYVTTGDAFTGPAGDLTDAVVALDLKSGAIAWSYQDTRDDIWVAGCRPGVAGCGPVVGPDWDFGSSIALQALPDGREVLVGGHKGGVALALDPDRRGALLWRTNLAAAPPPPEGDIAFGGAFDRSKAYFALQATAAMAAVDLKTGARLWTTPVSPVPGRQGGTGASSAVTAIPGVVFSGGWDGVLHAYAAGDGRRLWSFDTARSFETVNRVAAKGGSMGAPGVTVAGGMVFVGSGYVGVRDGAPGNVVLAFSAAP